MNKPVAWIINGRLSDERYRASELDVIIPLYTHPVEEDESFDRTASHMAGEYVAYKAELTDEEINKLWAKSHEDGIAMQQGFTTQQHYFANLILRKASEK